jgi:hypothetical protein
MSKNKKEKKISELVLMLKLVRERITDYARLQEQSRRELKRYAEIQEKDVWLERYLRFLTEGIFERKVILNALEKHSIEIKKEIRRLNKEQNLNNNKNGK